MSHKISIKERFTIIIDGKEVELSRHDLEVLRTQIHAIIGTGVIDIKPITPPYQPLPYPYQPDIWYATNKNEIQSSSQKD